MIDSFSMEKLKLSLSPAYALSNYTKNVFVCVIKSPSEKEASYERKFLVREDGFYSMFSEFSALIVSAAKKLFVSYMESFPSSEDYEVRLRTMRRFVMTR